MANHKAKRNSTTFTKENAPRQGRIPGAKGKYSTLRSNAQLKASLNNITVLEVMEGFACDETIPPELRLRASAEVAPYKYRRMASEQQQPTAPTTARVTVYLPDNKRDQPPSPGDGEST